jgi:integrase
MRKPKMEVREYTVLKNGQRIPHPKYPYVIDLRSFGNGREFFASRNEANTRLVELQKRQAKHGQIALSLSSRDLHDFAWGKETLDKVGKTIRDAVSDYIARLPKCSTTVEELAGMVLAKKEKEGRGRETIKHARMYFKRICEKLGDRAVGSVTREEIAKWLDALPANRAKVYGAAANLFNEAVERGLILASPMAQMKKPATAKRAPVAIYTPSEIRKVLKTAQSVAPDMVAYLAIGAFAGVRSDVKDTELARMQWSDVRLTPTADFPNGHIQIRAEIAKKAKRRLIPIQPNLRAWLLPRSREDGPVMPPPKAARTQRGRVFKAAGVTAKRNSLRHSFATYRLAATGDATLTARELGHPSVELVYSTYAELLTRPEDAAAYWNVTPEKAE